MLMALSAYCVKNIPVIEKEVVKWISKKTNEGPDSDLTYDLYPGYIDYGGGTNQKVVINSEKKWSWSLT
jgi:hypothetical protein